MNVIRIKKMKLSKTIDDGKENNKSERGGEGHVEIMKYSKSSIIEEEV